jgi:hypothetical protein
MEQFIEHQEQRGRNMVYCFKVRGFIDDAERHSTRQRGVAGARAPATSVWLRIRAPWWMRVARADGTGVGSGRPVRGAWALGTE